jgi:hypothetical protein
MNAAPANRGDLNALIIDDEALIRSLIKAALEILGVMKTDTADDGTQNGTA